MAKGNMLLGQARGSVGDIVFSRVNGQQVIKSKASEVKNPQTTAQLIQRIILNTISQAYSKMSEICDHSFEGIANGQMSMSYFMQKNLNLLRYTLSQIGDLNASAPCFAPIGNNGLASNSYVIAKGSLPEILPVVAGGGVDIAIANNTYAAVLAATGLQRGDQLTIITVDGEDLSDQKFVYSRIILDPRDAEGGELGLETEFITNNAINAANPRNENRGHSYSYGEGAFTASVATSAINMGCAIASRQKADGSWLRSNAVLLLAEDAQIGYSMQEALDLFASGGIDVESSKYLNNALRNVRKAAASSSNPGGNTSEAVAAPVISGTTPFSDTTEVSITAGAGATIHYTTDGSTPTAASTTYSAPFTLSDSATVKAIAIIEESVSTVASKVFTKSSGGGGDDNEND